MEGNEEENLGITDRPLKVDDARKVRGNAERKGTDVEGYHEELKYEHFGTHRGSMETARPYDS